MYVRVAGLPSIVIAVREIVSEESWNRTRKKRERKWIRRTEQTTPEPWPTRSLSGPFPGCGGHKRQSVI